MPDNFVDGMPPHILVSEAPRERSDHKDVGGSDRMATIVKTGEPDFTNRQIVQQALNHADWSADANRFINVSRANNAETSLENSAQKKLMQYA